MLATNYPAPEPHPKRQVPPEFLGNRGLESPSSFFLRVTHLSIAMPPYPTQTPNDADNTRMREGASCINRASCYITCAPFSSVSRAVKTYVVFWSRFREKNGLPQVPESTILSSHVPLTKHSRSRVSVLSQVIVELFPASAANHSTPSASVASAHPQKKRKRDVGWGGVGGGRRRVEQSRVVWAGAECGGRWTVGERMASGVPTRVFLGKSEL